VLAGINEVLDEPAPEVVVVDLADFSVKLRIRWWIEPAVRARAIDTRDKVLRAIGETLPAHGITMPFPTHKVLFDDRQLIGLETNHAQRRIVQPKDS
jgi:small-conductance mechanosensitive channel